jgi:hypothetical protein
MARTTHLFVGGDGTLAEVRSAVEAVAGASFEVNRKGEAVLALGSTNVYLAEGHHFDDEDIEWAHGGWIKLRSEYPYWIEVRDGERDIDRQVEVAGRVFQALKNAGHWRLVLILDAQQILDHYEPKVA